MKIDNDRKIPETDAQTQNQFENQKKSSSNTGVLNLWDDVKKTLDESILKGQTGKSKDNNKSSFASKTVPSPNIASTKETKPVDGVNVGADLNDLFDILKTKSEEKIREEIKAQTDKNNKENIKEEKQSEDSEINYIPLSKTYNVDDENTDDDDDSDDDVKIFERNTVPVSPVNRKNVNMEDVEDIENIHRKNANKNKVNSRIGNNSKKINESSHVDTGNRTNYSSDEDEDTETGMNSQRKNAFSFERMKKDALYNVSESEYTSINQNDEIFKNYSKVYIGQFVNLIVCIILFGLAFYLELAPFFKLTLPAILNPSFYNVVYILFDLQFLMLAAWIVNKSLLYGLKSLIRNDINIYAVTLIIFCITFLHTIITYNMKSNMAGINLFNAITIFLFVILTLNNIMCIYKDLLAFKVVCSKKNKYGVKILKRPLYEKIPFSEFMSDTTNTATAQVAGFITNFFRKSDKKTKSEVLRVLLIITSFEAVIIFGVSLALKFDAYDAISNIVILMLAALPFCTAITRTYPIFRVQKRLYGNGAAIIGDASFEEYSDTSVFSVYDRDIFPPDRIKVVGIRVYENNRIDTVLQHLSCLFETINSPLYHVLKASSNFAKGFDKNIVIIDIKDEGICFVSNGQKLFAGNFEYMTNLGLAPPLDENFDHTFLKSSGNICFMSTENEIISKMYLKYELTADFEEIVRNLARLNICLGIRTLDPNVNDELLRKLVANPKFCIKTVKIYNVDDKQKNETILDSGVVSKTTLKSLIEGLAACNKTCNVIKSNFLIQMIAAVIGAVLACFMIFMGDMTSINTFHIFLFQSFWIVTVLILSNLTPH